MTYEIVIIRWDYIIVSDMSVVQQTSSYYFMQILILVFFALISICYFTILLWSTF